MAPCSDVPMGTDLETTIPALVSCFDIVGVKFKGKRVKEEIILILMQPLGTLSGSMPE